MNLATKLRVIQWREAGKSWAFITLQLIGAYSPKALRNAAQHRAVYLGRAAAGVSDSAVNAKTNAFPEVDTRLAAWCHAVRARGRKRVPLSLAILRS